MWPAMYFALCLQKILQHQELSANVKLNLDTFLNSLTESQCALHDAHNNLAEDDDML